MLDGVIRRLGRLSYQWLCAGALRTPPLRHRPAPLRIVSMLRHNHVLMYLLAIKSFYRRIDGGTIAVLDDGTLTETDRKILHEHIEALQIVRIDEVATGPCPQGGTWERLLFILDHAPESYIVQLDADILTTGPLPDVVAAIRANRAFTLRGGSDETVVDLPAAAARISHLDARHLQIRAELMLPQLPAELGRLYIRGSSGFAGYARGGPGRGMAEAFSTRMEAMLGRAWHEWGTEQVTSNFVVANSPDPLALPWPTYCCFEPTCDGTGADLIHFIGTWRYQRGVYIRKSRAVIAELMSEAGGANRRGNDKVGAR
jgi:hypothetical protein